MVVRVSVVHPPDRVADWDSSQESIVPHTTSPGERSKFKIQSVFLLNAYRFCTKVVKKL